MQIQGKSRMEGIGSWTEANDTGDPVTHLQVERSKVKVIRPINILPKNQPYLQNRKANQLQTWYVDGV